MRWPWQRSDIEQKPSPNLGFQTGLLRTAEATNPLVATAVLTTLLLTAARLYRTRLKRISTVAQIPTSHFHEDLRVHPLRHSLLGIVVRISDGDGIRLYHTPGGRLAGWRWLRQVPSAFARRRQSSGAKSDTQRSWLAENTLNVRFSGIDAPELAHFGHPAQPGAEEATEFLRGEALWRWARVYPHSRDQYGRVVATVFVSSWHLGGRLLLQRWKDAGIDVVRAGWATVYEGKFGAMFGGAERERALRDVEAVAKQRQLGIWGRQACGDINGKREGSGKPGLWSRLLQWTTKTKHDEPFESPKDFKARMKKQDEEESQTKK